MRYAPVWSQHLESLSCNQGKIHASLVEGPTFEPVTLWTTTLHFHFWAISKGCHLPSHLSVLSQSGVQRNNHWICLCWRGSAGWHPQLHHSTYGSTQQGCLMLSWGVNWSNTLGNLHGLSHRTKLATKLWHISWTFVDVQHFPKLTEA